MNTEANGALDSALERDLFTRHPLEAAGLLEKMPAAAVATIFAEHDARTLAPLVESLSPATLPQVLAKLPETLVADTINRIAPARVAGILRVLTADLRARLIERLEPQLKADASPRPCPVCVKSGITAVTCARSGSCSWLMKQRASKASLPFRTSRSPIPTTPSATTCRRRPRSFR
jgi:hypothetical protein